jgi:xanthine dehydrogenase YagR molybdenum-binding subunit
MMATTPQWPKAEDRSLIGKRINRLDGPVKSSGAAKYAYDMNLPGMLFARAIASRHASAKVEAIDTAAAEALPGVRAVWKDDTLIGQMVRFQGQMLAAVAADTEEQAAEAAKAVVVTYTPDAIQVRDDDPQFAEGRPASRDEGDVEAAMAAAHKVSEGRYGIPAITHCCLEAHGQVSEFKDNHMYFWPSTQNVSRYAEGMGEALGVPETDIHVDCQYMGGGFGSKFSHDKWGIVGGLLSKQTGKPVKLMLERDMELQDGGNRPSTYGTVKIGVDAQGVMTAFDTSVWGTGGFGGFRPPPLPYVFTRIPNQRAASQRIATNRGSQRAWRAPGHPQGCLITMAAVEDAAAALGMDALEFFKANLHHTDRAELYAQQLDIAAEMIGYKQKAHLRGDKTPGPLKRGLGIGIHTWGGMGHPSDCEVSIHPDGSVTAKIGTQDLGVGTRTAIAIVLADTLGLPLEAVQVLMGKNAYPVSGASGGSTTIGGISSSTLMAATAARDKLFAAAAQQLGVGPETLVARDGKVGVAGDAAKSMTWKEACGLVGPGVITERGSNDGKNAQEMKLMDAGVGGVQIADVTVDIETGVTTLNEMVAVQDCGLIIDLKTAESQVYGGLIMGITYALYEECVYDVTTGRMLNADMEFYRLAGLKDVGKMKVHMQTGPGFDERGVIGLGEPPVISPGAAISNAVANACGVRVPDLPLTPDRVIAALQLGGVLA